jgi:hypothetical protein
LSEPPGLLGATEAQLAEMINQLLLKIREMHAPIFTPEMIDVIEAELMDNYRKQAEPTEKLKGDRRKPTPRENPIRSRAEQAGSLAMLLAMRRAKPQSCAPC